MITYQFILKPIKPFFFGGEKSTFNKADYLMKSELFPQQTSALGLVREHILGIYNLLSKTKTNVDLCNKLIGPGSFNIEFKQGAILKISPIQIIKHVNNSIKKSYYLSNGLINDLTNQVLDANINYGENTETYKTSYLINLKNKVYDGKQKDMISEIFIDNNGESENVFAEYDKNLLKLNGTKKIIQSDKGIFLKHIQVGNTKNYNGLSIDNAFYKQISYQLKSGYAFVFEVDIDSNVLEKSLECKNKIIGFGGRGSKFSLEVVSNTTIPKIESVNSSKRILLISDALVYNKIYEYIDTCITNTISFRHAITTNKDAIYNNRLNREYTKTIHFGSERKCLLKRGSILFTNNFDKLQVLFHNEHYEKLGYNKFIQL